jgi:uncharacterized membrane protein
MFAGVSVTRHESRPMPSPQEMAEYNALIPDGAERFMKNWETEGEHRRSIDLLKARVLREEVKAAATDRRLGLVFGWIIGMSGLGGLIYMGLHNVSFGGMAAVVAAVASLVWAVRRSTETPAPPDSENSAN